MHSGPWRSPHARVRTQRPSTSSSHQVTCCSEAVSCARRLLALSALLHLEHQVDIANAAPNRVLDACLRTGELQIAEQVLAIKGFPEEAVDGTLIQRAREQIAQAEVQAAERRLEESTTTGQLDWRIERGPDLERSGIKKAAAQNESK